MRKPDFAYAKTSLCPTLRETQKTGFVVMWLNFLSHLEDKTCLIVSSQTIIRIPFISTNVLAIEM